MKLNTDARDTLRAWEVSQAAWIRHHFGEDAKTWYGDACGCTDDRCIGYHHHGPDDRVRPDGSTREGLSGVRTRI